MWLKLPIIFIFFLALALVQESFLAYINILGIVPSLIFIAFFVIMFFEDVNRYQQGFFIALMGGFFLDLLSPFYFGISIISLIIIYFFKNALTHFMNEWQTKYLIVYFAVIFSINFLLYQGLLYVSSILFGFVFYLESTIFIALAYNVVVACIFFYFYNGIVAPRVKNNQLKLFN